MTWRVALLPLMLLLAGCQVPLLGGSACEPFEVPAARGGSQFSYAADGRIFTLSLHAPVSNLYNETLKDAKLHIAIGTEPSPRLTARADTESAWQATYWLDTEGMRIATNDEWIATRDAQAVQVNYLNGEAQGVKHMNRYTRMDQPPLLMAPLFWHGSAPPGALRVSDREGPSWHRRHHARDHVPVSVRHAGRGLPPGGDVRVREPDPVP